MAEAPKFELHINNQKQCTQSNIANFGIEEEDVRNGRNQNQDCVKLQSNSMEISDDQFFQKFDQIFVVDFQENQPQNTTNPSYQIQNPETQFNPNQKQLPEFHTMTDQQLQSCQASQSPNQDQQQPYRQPISSSHIEQMQAQAQITTTTPQKFKKQIKFEQIENNEQYWKLLWAPKKKGVDARGLSH